MSPTVVLKELTLCAVLLGVAAPTLGQPRLITRNASGAPANGDSDSYGFSMDGLRNRMSADGRRIVFTSNATDLAPGDTSGKVHIYLWDGRAKPAPDIVRISVDNAGDPANRSSYNAAISPDGNHVAFNTNATDLGGPTTGDWHNVYVRSIGGERPTWRTTWVSRAYNGQAPTYHCGRPSMSNVGLVAFECLAGNMIPSDKNDSMDVFVANVEGRAIERVSTTSGGYEAKNGYSSYPSISADGDIVAFQSFSNTLTGNVKDDTNSKPDVFVKNRATGLLTRILSRQGVEPDGAGLKPCLSADGRFVAFESQATNMMGPSLKTPLGVSHVYRRDLTKNAIDGTTLISMADDGTPHPWGGFRPSVNADGTVVAYDAGDQIYVWHQPPEGERYLVTLASRADDGARAQGQGFSASLAPTVEGQGILSWASNSTSLHGAGPQSRWHVFVSVVGRPILFVKPTTVVAANPPSAVDPDYRDVCLSRFVALRALRAGTRGLPWVGNFLELFGLQLENRVSEAAFGPPTVTVGGTAAKGVETPDENTLRFAAPLLPAGSSNTVVIRYADGEVVTLPTPLKSMALVPNSPTDTDKDGLKDWWELTYGLDPNEATDATTVQANGMTPLQSLAQQHNPTATTNRYLAEGATGSFLTRIALANPSTLPATALLRFLKKDRTVQSQTVAVPATGRATVDVEALAGMNNAEFATTIESDLPVVVDRTMRWSTTGRYGSHAERAVQGPSTVWYLAEGATHSSFDLFYLLQNPGTTRAEVQVKYLLPSGDPIIRSYGVDPSSRENIWVDLEAPALANTDVSAVITSTNGVPIIVERAMYANAGWTAGHESAGITAPSLDWFLAEGATGSLFDLFVLVANPNDTTAQITATYLLENGTTLVKPYEVAANSRFNIWVDYEDSRLANAAVSTLIRSTNGVPVIVERAMWWPDGQWYEAHNSPGSTTTGTLWALAEGEVGSPSDGEDTQTYILIANTSSFAGQATVTLLFEDGTTTSRTVPLAANSRTNVPVGFMFGAEAIGKRFGATVESVTSAGGTPQIVVERAMYASPGGVFWAAGTNALATKLR